MGSTAVAVSVTPHLPSRVRHCPVVDEGSEDDVGQASFQAAQRTFPAFAGGELAFVVGLPARVVALVRQGGQVAELSLRLPARDSRCRTCAAGTPKTPTTALPMNFSTTPPNDWIADRAAAK
jgi:hypothetical protein